MLNKIVLASNNVGKIKEFQHLFVHYPINLIPQATLTIPDTEETGLTFVENALIKARHACQLSGLASIADDSGLVVDALGGKPGIYSARFGGVNNTNDEKIAKILDEMRDVPEEKRTARFVCIIVLLRHAADPLPLICEGIWEGSILTEPEGNYGFGYDPIFKIPEYDSSVAALTLEIKSRLSHRAQALNKLIEKLKIENLLHA